MRANEKLLRPVYEVNYLRAENVARYRLIIRYFLPNMKRFITGCTKKTYTQ